MHQELQAGSVPALRRYGADGSDGADGACAQTVTPLDELDVIDRLPPSPDTEVEPLAEPGSGRLGAAGVEKHIGPLEPVGRLGAPGRLGALGRLGAVPQTVTPLAVLPVTEALPPPPDTDAEPLPEPGRPLEGGAGVEKQVCWPGVGRLGALGRLGAPGRLPEPGRLGALGKLGALGRLGAPGRLGRDGVVAAPEMDAARSAPPRANPTAEPATTIRFIRMDGIPFIARTAPRRRGPSATPRGSGGERSPRRELARIL